MQERYDKVKKLFNLGFVLARAGYKLKTEGSYLGIFWYLLDPIFTFLLLWGIFADRLGRGIDDYPLYLFLGIIAFSFFSRVTIESMKLIVDNRWIVRSIKFPYESLVLASILKNLFSLFFETVLLIILALLLRQSVAGFIFFPVILFFFCFFTYGVSLFLATLYVYFCDLDNIWAYFSRLLWFATPIFYQIGGQNKLLILNSFNPLYLFISIFREIVIYSRMPSASLTMAALAFTILSFTAGTAAFTKLKCRFPEKI